MDVIVLIDISSERGNDANSSEKMNASDMMYREREREKVRYYTIRCPVDNEEVFVPEINCFVNEIGFFVTDIIPRRPRMSKVPFGSE